MLALPPFTLERYFAEHEFTAPFLLSASDCESLSLTELLSHADEDRLRLWSDLSLGYTESRGHPDLLVSIADLYEGLGPEHIQLVTPCEGIFLSMHALLRPGDHLVATSPTYQSLHEVARSLGCEVTPWNPEEPVDRLLEALRPETQLIIVNLPHNPTGATVSRPDFARLLEEADRRDITTFSDEMYRYCEHSPEDRLPSACELSERAVTLAGLSKSFGLPGLRMGWLVCRQAAFLRRVGELKDYTTLCASAPSEVLALIALKAREALLARTRAILAANLKLLGPFFERHQDRLAWKPPRAGPVCLVRHRLPFSDAELARRLREEQGVLIAEGSHFGSPPGWFRLGFGRRNLPHALARLDRFLADC